MLARYLVLVAAGLAWSCETDQERRKREHAEDVERRWHEAIRNPIPDGIEGIEGIEGSEGRAVFLAGDECNRVPADVVRRLGRRVDKLGDCVDVQRRRKSAMELPAWLNLEFDVRPDGSVENARVSKHKIPSELQGCITAVLTELTFSSAETETCQVSIPFELRVRGPRP